VRTPALELPGAGPAGERQVEPASPATRGFCRPQQVSLGEIVDGCADGV